MVQDEKNKTKELKKDLSNARQGKKDAEYNLQLLLQAAGGQGVGKIIGELNVWKGKAIYSH